MKTLGNYLLLLIFGLFTLGQVKSQTPNLKFKGIGFPQNTDGIYQPEGTFNGKTYWVGPDPDNKYVIYFRDGSWGLADWSNDTSEISFPWTRFSVTAESPIGKWEYGESVSFAAPALDYSRLYLEESMVNDGSISGKLTIHHNKFNDQSFGGVDGDDFVKKGYAKVANLPSNLEASVIRLNDSTLELSLLNKAQNHAVDTNFMLTFNDDAYANGGKADSTYYNSQEIDIEFINIIKVAKNGGDYDSIQTALNNADNYDIIDIAEGVYTECVVMPKTENVNYIRFKGAGPSKTIIQADTAPGIAKSRVFDLFGAGPNAYNTPGFAYFEGITIQNGYLAQKYNTRGGGILGKFVELNNCRVINNAIISNGGAQGSGGGIQADNVKMYHCEVSGNRVDNDDKGGSLIGGGIWGKYIHAENCTISGNFSRNSAGGIALGGGSNFECNIINTTITNNEAVSYGGGIDQYDSFNCINSIIYGNKSEYGNDLYQQNNRPVKIWNSVIGDITSRLSSVPPNVKGTPISSDPKLDTLAFNCSHTRTHALLSGSPAIDAGLDSSMIPEYDQRGFKAYNTKDIGSHEAVKDVYLSLAKDSICLGSTEAITLEGSHKYGVFAGTGIKNDTFYASDIKKESFSVITYTVESGTCTLEAVDSIFIEDNDQLTITKSKDSICLGSNELIELKGSDVNGTFTGEGIVNDSFTAIKISNEGYSKFTFSTNGMGCTKDAVDSILVKEVVQLSFTMSKDSICIGSEENIDLKGSHGFATFTGEGVTGNTFSAAAIQNEGYVRITYAAGPNDCAEEAVDSIYVYKCVNSIENQQLANVTMYPNPASDRLWIKTAIGQNAAIRISDIAGNVLLETELNKEQEGINIKDLPKGIYVVSTSIGGLRNIQKFVKL